MSGSLTRGFRAKLENFAAISYTVLCCAFMGIATSDTAASAADLQARGRETISTGADKQVLSIQTGQVGVRETETIFFLSH